MDAVEDQGVVHWQVLAHDKLAGLGSGNASDVGADIVKLCLSESKEFFDVPRVWLNLSFRTHLLRKTFSELHHTLELLVFILIRVAKSCLLGLATTQTFLRVINSRIVAGVRGSFEGLDGKQPLCSRLGVHEFVYNARPVGTGKFILNRAHFDTVNVECVLAEQRKLFLINLGHATCVHKLLNQYPHQFRVLLRFFDVDLLELKVVVRCGNHIWQGAGERKTTLGFKELFECSDAKPEG